MQADNPEKFDEPFFRRLFLLAEIGNFTAEEYEQYQKSLDNMGDYDNIINTAVEEAENRGRAEGRNEVRVETARNLLSLGVDVKTISKATGLEVEKIEALRDK